MVLLTALLGLAISIAAAAEAKPTAVASDVERVVPTDESLADLGVLAAGNAAFAMRMYELLAAESEENLFFSPLSVSMALGMLSAGAHGETLLQIEEALSFALPQERLHAAFNALDWTLESRQRMPGEFGEGFTLNLVNSLWGQAGYDFLPTLLDVLGTNYGAGMRAVDYAADPEAARLAINAWVEDATNDRIMELLKPGMISREMLLTLVNAVYFNAPWAEPFKEANTEPGPFTLLDGTEIEVPQMHQTESHGYVAGEDYQAVELNYDGNELSMLVIVPNEASFAAVDDRFDLPFVNSVLDAIGRERVILTMPRFEFEWEEVLDRHLARLGLEDAFTPSEADFSGIDGTRDFFVGLVIHKAFVSVDEAGTEAAAATAIAMAGSAMTEPTYYPVTIDRPFLFVIRDKPTGSILFIGRVLDPR